MNFAFRLENIINIETLYVDDNENVMKLKCNPPPREYTRIFFEYTAYSVFNINS